MKRFVVPLLALAACAPVARQAAPEGSRLVADTQVCQLKARYASPPLKTQAQRDQFLDACLEAKGHTKNEG
jgi:hypothetical protein